MLKKSIGKRVTTGLVSAAMLASATVAVLPGMAFTASAAGEMLGMTDFEDGIGLPWHTCVTQPANLKFAIEDGVYKVEIIENGGTDVGGASRWDAQFRHRKLEIYSGNSYTVKAEITASQSGEIYTKIGDLSGNKELWHNGMGDNQGRWPNDFNQTWNCIPMTANQTLTLDSTFTASETLEVAEWAFHFGGAGEYQPNDCFPNGTILTFDNMSLYNNTDDRGVFVAKEPAPEYGVHGNQVGYYTNLNKKATYHSDSSFSDQAISIIDAATGKEVYKGTAKGGSTLDRDSGFYTAVFDFSDFKTPGTYYFATSGTTRDSYDFTIGDDIYEGVVTNAVNYFYQNRSGVPTEEAYITSTGMNDSKADLVDKAGHNPDEAYLQDKWIKAYKNDGSDVQKSNGTIDGTGGWYDAGDHGKYVVNGGIAVWTLQNMYEWSLDDRNNTPADKFADASGTVVVPEAGNGAPDILDETRVELEWFFKMLVPSSYTMTYNTTDAEGNKIGSTTGEYTDMVFHKLHDSKWTGLAVHCWDYQESKDWAGITRIVKPPSTAATLNVSATAAQAARLWQEYDKDFAAECLDVAKRTYAAAKANPELYAPLDQAIGGGAYGDNNVKDDFYWAASELYITTGDATYKTDMESYAEAYTVVSSLDGGENSGSFTSFNWGNTASLGNLSLFLNGESAGANLSKIEDSIIASADLYVAEQGKQGFGTPYHGTTFTDPINIGLDESGKPIEVYGYEWGSNSFVVNNAIVMAYAYVATGDAKYLNGAAEALDYIFGRNAMDFSYVTGYGTYHLVNPHHRFWSHELDANFPYAPSGVMSGGPGSGLQDPYVGGLGYKRGEVASQLCFVDSIEAWSVNEVTINWNSPFAWITSFVADEANGEIVEQPGDPTDIKWGDVDCDGQVKTNDVILLNRFLAEDTTITVSEQGIANADCEYDGDTTGADATKILQYLAGLIAYEELGNQ